ncbi:MAG: hypothetical protein J6V83_03185, partial [Clostridia bacterium]|nr:hypothetical protein [Clostridia bacterium]
MKKRLTAFLVLACLIIVTATGIIACSGDNGTSGNPQQLAAPVVTLNGNTATWEANPKAIGFEVSLNGSLLKVSATTT